MHIKMSALLTCARSAATVANGVEITEEGIAAGVVAQRRSERWVSNTAITESAVLR